MKLEELTKLNGRSFICKDNNICKFIILGDSGSDLQGNWKYKPSKENIIECTSWIKNILNCTIISFNDE